MRLFLYLIILLFVEQLNAEVYIATDKTKTLLILPSSGKTSAEELVAYGVVNSLIHYRTTYAIVKNPINNIKKISKEISIFSPRYEKKVNHNFDYLQEFDTNLKK